MSVARWRAAGALCLVPALVAGCLSMDEPPPTASVPPPSAHASVAPPTVTPSEAPRRQDELVIAVPELPDSLLPPATDLADGIALDLVNRSLYRLDDQLVPQPDLAAKLPTVSKDGLTWTIDLALDGARFASGRPVTADDVSGSLDLARSPTCKLGNDLCGTAFSALESTEVAKDGTAVALHLKQPFSPLLAEVLARAPVLDMTAVDGAATSIVGAAGELDPTAPDDLVTSVYRAMGADDCLTEQPPDGCRMVDHRADLEAMLTQAGVALPRLGPFTDSTGQVDAAAYAAALLDRVAALGQVLTGEGRDRRAAALGLLDGFVPAFGAGPYRVISVAPGERMVLEPVPGQSDPPSIGRVVLQAVADTSIAVTMLQAGDVDWVPRIDHALADAINGSGRPATAGLRPLESSWLVVFNTRKGHPYADALTRAAFVACIDAPGLTASVGGGEAIVADTPLAAGSWAMGPAKGRGRDVAWAERRLDSAGWTMGSDGIRVRDGQRLSTSVALRGSQVALLAMMQAAAGQLRECGIELAIEDLDVTGDRLLQQIRWPNDFDTLIMLRALGADPDADLEAFESDHATSEDRPSDFNPGGFKSSGVDRRVAEARETLDQDERTTLYGEVQDLLTTEAPAWWVWYETGWSAVADRVRDGQGDQIDPTRPRYEHDIRSWTLLPIAAPTTSRGASGAAPEPSGSPGAVASASPVAPSEAASDAP